MAIKLLDQLQDPRKKVIKMMSEGQTTNLVRAYANLIQAHAQHKRGDNGILTVIHQLLALGYHISHPIGDLQTPTKKTQQKLNYLKHALRSRRDISHKMF